MNNRFRAGQLMIRLVTGLLLTLALLMAGQASAATCTSRQGGGNWSSNSTWSNGGGCPNGGPANGDSVIIASGDTVVVDTQTAYLGDVTIEAGATLTGGNNWLIVGGNFTNNGTFTASNGGVYLFGNNPTLTGNFTFNDFYLANGTTLTLNGNIQITGGTNLTSNVLASTCPTNYTATLSSGTVLDTCPGGTPPGGSGTGGGTSGTATAAPGTCVSDNSIGTYPWSGLGNVGASDNQYATADGLNSSITEYLKCTGYNFNIPANATIDGIALDIEGHSGKTFYQAYVHLVKGNAIQTGTNYGGTNNSDRLSRNNDSTTTYGGATNLWGNTWTAADINSANFGAAFAGQRGPYNSTDTASIDYMPITVYYTVPAGPSVTAITRAATSPTTAGTVSWTVTFSSGVSGVTAGNFSLANTGLGGAPVITSVTSANGTSSDKTWTLTASTGSGSGTLGLNLMNAGNIQDSNGNGLTGTLPFTGEIYTIDRTAPTVVSINRASGNPTSALNVSWTVTFSEAITGLTAGNFALVNTGLSGSPAITSVTGSGSTWTVTATTGDGTVDGSLGLNLTNSSGVADLVGHALANVPFTGAVYSILHSTMSCTTDNFSSGTLNTNLWKVQAMNGTNYTPRVVNVGTAANPDYRLRLTDANRNESAFAQLLQKFPGAGNKIVVVIDYYSYGGTGADGLGFILSDYSVPATPGGYGGSLGYAQNTNTNPNLPGFGGGWMGIGLDEYGNFPCNNEGRTGYPTGWVDPVLGAGASVCGGSGGGNHYVVVRGSGSGSSATKTVNGNTYPNYPLLANTGLLTAVAPSSGAAGATPYRYRFTIDHSDSVHAYITVERDKTGTGNNYQTLIPKFDIKKSGGGQVAVPQYWAVSFTASTGGATNYHEFKRVQVCANSVTSWSGPDHFNFNLGSGIASTCTPRSVTITAVDQNGNALSGYTGTISIATSSGHGDWSLKSGSGALTTGANDSGTANYTFAASDNGSVILNLRNTHADDLTVSAADTSANVSTTSSSLSFRDNAFVITPTDTLGSTAIAGRPHAMKAELWSKDPSTGMCAINTHYQGNLGLKAWIGRAANDPNGTAPTIGGASLPNAIPAANNVTLNFTNGAAAFTLGTTDVGKFGLSLRDDTSKFAKDISGNARAIDGSTSADLTVRPFALTLRNIQVASDPANSLCTDPAAVRANPAITSASGTIFTCAGYPFQAQTEAVQWQAADDTNNDGIPDTGANLTDNPVTAHFAWGTTITASTPITPTAGVIGTLSGSNIPASAYSGGSATATSLKYSEVGSVTLQPTAAANYLNTTGLTIPGWGSVVGRYIPGQFSVSVKNDGSLQPFCTSTGTKFVYTGQSFGYGTTAGNPSFLITAQTWGGGTTTQNYTGNFMRLATTGITLGPVTSDGTQVGATGTKTALTRAAVTSSLTDNGNGTVTYQLGNDTFTYTKDANALIPPYTSDIRLDLTAVKDQDSVKYTGPTAVTAKPLGVEIRYGRINLLNAHGSELTDLSVPMTAEYYASTTTPGIGAFVTNTADTCTSGVTLSLSDPTTTDNLNATNDTCVIDSAGISGAFACANPVSVNDFAEPPNAGNFNLWLKAPGNGKTGSADITATVPTWLQYDWTGAGLADPTARLSFGIYSGSPRQIYMREIY